MSSPSVFTLSAPAPGGRRRNESVWQFLERSTESVAVDTRRRWDAWLARMPATARNALIHRLKNRLDTQVSNALAELVTSILLESVYSSVDVEPATGTGSYTDFAVNVPVRTHFEVRRKSPPDSLTGDARRLADIAGELDKIESPDFWLDVDAHTGVAVPSMRIVRRKVESWLDSLDYGTEVNRAEQERQARQIRAAEHMPGLDSSPQARASYMAAHPPHPPPVFEDGGEGWHVRISAHPRASDARGPGQPTVGIHSAGEAHIETADNLEKAVRDKLRQHAGLTDPLVVVLDLSSPIADDIEVTGMLYGPSTTTARDRSKGIWPDPLKQPPRPAAVLIVRGVWLGAHEASAEFWLPPGVASPLLPGPWDVRALGSGRRLATIQTATESAANCLDRAAI
jgi:hypothetical protein